VLRQWLDRQNSPPPFFRYDQQTGFRLPLVSALLALALYRTPYDHFDGSPVDGLSRNSPWLGGLLKSNMLFNVPASASKEPGIRSPPSQLSSMKRRIDVLVGQSVIDIVVPGEKAKRDSRRGPLRYVLLRMETGDELRRIHVQQAPHELQESDPNRGAFWDRTNREADRCLCPAGVGASTSFGTRSS
jgi:hypothetical protein